MKKLRNGLITTIHYLCLVGVIALGFIAIIASGGGGGGGGGSGGGTSNFTITYTDTTDITSWEWAFDWHVENADRSVRGPYDSNGTGVVDLGQDTRPSANITLDMANTFYYTFMEVPVEHHTYYTGHVSGTSETLTVTLQNAGVGDEMSLAYATWFWTPIDQNPFSFLQSMQSSDITANDGNANVFVSYRSSSADEPLTRYGFMLDFPVSWIGTVPITLDVNTFFTRSSRDWTSTVDLSTDEPFVMAQRKGLIITPVGGSTVEVIGTQGTFGLPDQFPADRWYLASGSIWPDVVAEFDPADTSPVALVPFDRNIDENSMIVNSVDGTFTVTVTGTDPIGCGMLRLIFSFKPWEIYFPGSALQFTGDTGVLQLPALPGYASLPNFDTAITLELYRLDGTTTPGSMLRWYLNQKGNPFPSFAMTSKTKMW